MVAQHDALAKLPEIRTRKHLAQLGLAHQHDLDQLRGRSLEVREQADLLEHLGREVLGLVDDQQGRQTLLEPRDQEAVQRQQVLRLGAAALLDAVFVEEHPEEVEGLEPRIEQEGRRSRRIELGQQRVEERRLARSHFARQQDEPLARAHAVDQRRQPLTMGLAQVEERRIRRHLERAAQESVMLPIHGPCPYPPIAGDALAVGSAGAGGAGGTASASRSTRHFGSTFT